MKRNAPFVISVYLLAGCASTTGVIQAGKDTFMISREDNGPASSLGSVKAAVYKDANAYCAGQGKTMEIVRETDVPRSFGQFPQTSLHFKCA